MAGIVLLGGGRIAFEALDPATGNPVAGVQVTGAVISALDLSDTDDGEGGTPLNPAFIPGPA